MEVGRYRKKPVEVEAVRWNGENEDDLETRGLAIVEWINGLSGDSHLQLAERAFMEEAGIDLAQLIWVDDLTKTISIRTLEGDMIALPGDWIIRGVAGEFYPCKDAVFAVSYTSVSRA